MKHLISVLVTTLKFLTQKAKVRVDCLCPGVTDTPVCTHNWGVIEEAGERSMGKELAVQT